jgi:hypothetical protein
MTAITKHSYFRSNIIRKHSALALAVLLTLPFANAQAAEPVAKYWIDVANFNSSMPGMGGLAGMMGGDKGTSNRFGSTTGGSQGKWMDTALHTNKKPAGTNGNHAIPSGMNMTSPLPLDPVVRGSRPTEREEVYPEKPQGRMLFYWGCGDKIRSGQPRIVDMAKMSSGEYGKFLQGRMANQRRGARSVEGNATWPWPNTTEPSRKYEYVPDSASLVGEQTITGEGVPDGFKFNVDSTYDFMPKLDLSSSGEAKDAIKLSWNSVNNAQAYFTNAMGMKENKDMIIWSASDQPDPGWGLMDYLSPSEISKLLKEKVILSSSTQTCTIPAGIFADVQGAMVQAIAYGPEMNVAFPPRPASKKAAWKPEWEARVRTKSQTNTILGLGQAMAGSGSGSNSNTNSSGSSAGSDSSGGRNYTSDSGSGGGALDKAKKLKDLFGF